MHLRAVQDPRRAPGTMRLCAPRAPGLLGGRRVSLSSPCLGDAVGAPPPTSRVPQFLRAFPEVPGSFMPGDCQLCVRSRTAALTLHRPQLKRPVFPKSVLKCGLSSPAPHAQCPCPLVLRRVWAALGGGTRPSPASATWECVHLTRSCPTAPPASVRVRPAGTLVS